MIGSFLRGRCRDSFGFHGFAVSADRMVRSFTFSLGFRVNGKR